MQSSEFFSLVPEEAMHQASCVTRGLYLLPNCDETWMLVFARYAYVPAPDGVARNAHGKTAGVDVIAYECDTTGRVFDWERRYETSGTCIEAAMDKLRFGLVNGLLALSNYEGVLVGVEELRDRAADIDWAQMPENLQ